MRTLFISCILIHFLSSFGDAYSQSKHTPPEREVRNSEGVWFGIYTKYQLSKRWSYYGEYHFRRRNGFQDMGQIYLRLGATYKLSNTLDVTLGVVNPYYWAPDQDDPSVDKIVPQYRLWEQIVFKHPFKNIKLYHQLRVEQRYRRSYTKGSHFQLTHRFRYKLAIYLPITKKKPRT